MPVPGKNFPGQKGYPTPNSAPDESVGRIFIVPNSDEWLGLLMWAAQTLSEEWRYYEWGELTPGQAAAAWSDINVQAYLNVCPARLPDGSRVIRLNPSTGHLEELADTGEWAEPTGDYAVPPTPAREGGTAEDQMCLAAANAAHVLEVLYESVTDSIAMGLESAEAYTALIAAFVAAVGWEFAPLAYALAAFFLAVFGVLYEVIKFIAADVWDSTFTNELVCALYGCASNDAGVVTFDWTCVQNKLAEGTNALNLDQLRLFGQLSYLVEIIGAADGLNQAGATTSVTDYDCSGCVSTSWCYEWDFTEGDGDFVALEGRGVYSPGVGWVSQVGDGFVACTIRSNMTEPLWDELTAWECDVVADGAAGDGYISNWYLTGSSTFNGIAYMDLPPGTPTYPGYGLANGSNTYTYDTSIPAGTLNNAGVNPVINDEAAVLVVTRLRLRGSGPRPALTGGHTC
jgi:hypothetical protein